MMNPPNFNRQVAQASERYPGDAVVADAVLAMPRGVAVGSTWTIAVG
jgi:hypothetical protein